MKPINQYTVISTFYDKLNYDCDYFKWSQYLYFLNNKYGLGSGACADAACGSGKMTILLKKAGMDIMGFDLSPQMLFAAKENAAKGAVSIEFVCADMQKFKAPSRLSFINCSCDGINYIEKTNIKKCLKNLYNNLSRGGVLAFDISSSHKLKNVIGNNVFFDDSDDITYIWSNTPNGDRVNMELVFFAREGAKYLRFDENHIQYIYEEEELKAALEEVGFSKIHTFDFLTENPPQKESLRIQFVAVKQA